MKIERVDESTVKCFLSNDELRELDITYKDFITKSEKAKDLVDRIIAQATEEVGYKPPQLAFDMQIMVVPEKGMVLIFSEKMPEEVKNNPSLMHYLEEMKKLLEFNQGGLKSQPQDASAKIPEMAIFCYASLWKVMAFACVLPTNIRVKSRLYKYGKYYYLLMEKGNASYDRYSRMCIHAMEYGSIYSVREESVCFLEEHARVIIPEKAIQKLTRIS